MGHIEINGVNYAVAWHGAGDPLVLLHGFTGSAAHWRALDFGAAQLAPDLLGHGDTDAPGSPARYGIAQAAADLIAIFDHYGLQRVALLGYSMGGRLALYTALHHPARIAALILESASPGLATEEARLARVADDEALAARILAEGIPAFVQHWENLPLFASQSGAAKAALRPARLGQRARGLANSLRGMGTGAQPSLWGDLPRLLLPVLLITGALDEKFTAIAQQMQASIPGAQHTVIDGAGHAVHLEQPDAYQGTVRAFLAQHAPRRGG